MRDPRDIFSKIWYYDKVLMIEDLRYNVDYRSSVEYECEKAVRDGLKIVVLYNALTINKAKCPDVIKNVGTHVAMLIYKNGRYDWNYQAVKNAIG